MSDAFLEATAAYHREMPPEPIDRDAAIAAATAIHADEIRSLLQTPAEMLTKREEALRDDVLAYLHGAIGDKPLATITRLALHGFATSLRLVLIAEIESAIQYHARRLATIEVERAEYDAQHG